MSYLSLPAGVGVRPEIEGATTAAQVRACAPSSAFVRGMRCATSAGLYIWDPSSLVADDGDTVLKPDDLGVLDPGRWILSPSRGGYERNAAPQADLGVDVPVLADWPDDLSVTTIRRIGVERVVVGGYSIGSGGRGVWLVEASLGLLAAPGSTAADLEIKINGNTVVGRTLPLATSSALKIGTIVELKAGDLVNVYWTPRGAGGTTMNSNPFQSWIKFVQLSRG